MLGTTSNCNFCGDDCQAKYPNAQVSCVVQGNGWTCNVVQCKPGYATCDPTMPCGDNTQTDANNCASCGNACPYGPNSTAVCNNSVCGLNCSPGYLNCGQAPSLGCPVQGQTDPMNCGGCGTVCMTPNATPGCAAGMCTIGQCNTGFLDCNHIVSDGCEINSLADPKNCGGCGTICAEANGTATCSSGACALGPCNTGFMNCDGKYTSGCNINVQTDVNNCGTCNAICNLAHATPTCTSGMCTIASCASGYQDCDLKPATGCEINTNSDTANCGSCGHGCVTPNATPSCTNGVCGIMSCNPGYKDCDGIVTNGCEINLNSDPLNCGSCNTKCQLQNAASGCSAGACTILSCNTGWADCDGVASNGCETNVGTDPSNCGVCKKVCSFPHAQTATCTGGICTLGVCAAGFADCDSDPTDTDGCETSISTDAKNCGQCGNQCSTPFATPACAGGNCKIGVCQMGYADCDGQVNTGCEVNTQTDINNCGACNNKCATACPGNVQVTGCSAGVCGILACAQNWYDIDQNCSTGCECPASTTSQSCAAAYNMTPTALTSPGSATPYSSNLIPALIGVTPNVAWVQITFTNLSNKLTYHPSITLTDPTGEFVMDVNSNCSGSTFTCNTENAPATAVTHWETAFSASPPADPTNIAFSNLYTGTVYVKVYRKTGAKVTCNSFKITASE
jgi:hypothetical protein